MMNIVIVGAGEIGCHIATLLSKEEHNIIIIDNDLKKINAISQTLDVAVRHGSASNWQLLDELFDLSPDLLIAVTNNDETNLVACSIAKQLGYPRTIARVHDTTYLNQTRLDFGRIFDVDYFINPELLVANDIIKYMLNPGSLLVENFAHGAVQLRILKVPPHWKLAGKTLHELRLPAGIMIGLILRETEEKEGGIPTGKKEVIFPHGKDRILANDEVTFIGETGAIGEIHQFLNISSSAMSSLVAVGGSNIALNLGKILEESSFNLTIIEKEYERCLHLAEKLPKAIILNHDATDVNFLMAEKIDNADLFVSCTRHDELNLLTAMIAKDIGCKKVAVTLQNPGYGHYAAQLGASYSVSPKISAASQVLSQVFSGTVRSLVSLYDNQAEIMEISVSANSSIVGIPLSELGPRLPADFLIAMIQNRGRIMIAHGNRIISPGDTVIVITSPKHIEEIKKIF